MKDFYLAVNTSHKVEGLGQDQVWPVVVTRFGSAYTACVLSQLEQLAVAPHFRDRSQIFREAAAALRELSELPPEEIKTRCDGTWNGRNFYLNGSSKALQPPKTSHGTLSL